MIHAEDLPFTSHLQTLVALISYLSCTEYRSRRAGPLAKSLGLDPNEVQATLDAFPAFFRQSKDDKGDVYWTVHLRYALRPYDKAKPSEKSEPLKPDDIAPWLNLVSGLVAQEQETSRLKEDLRQRYSSIVRNTWVTVVAASIAAVASVVAAFA